MIAQINGFGLTDIGCRRPENEDQYLLSSLVKPVIAARDLDCDSDSLVSNRLALLAVADGVGGNQGGAIASELAVEALGCFAQENELVIRHSGEDWELANLVRKGILKADEVIGSIASRHWSKFGMGTTLTAALIRYPELIIGHVGDSRCYLCRQGKLAQLTTDHTIAELYRETGELTREESVTSPMSNVLWNCLGASNDMSIEVETHVATLEPNDWLLLATDGLTAHVSDEEIQAEITKAQNPRGLCDQLKRMAIDRGGKDNITIIACNWCIRVDDNQSQIASRPNSIPDLGNDDISFGPLSRTDFV